MPEANSSSNNCQQTYANLKEATFPDSRSGMALRKHWWTLKKFLLYAKILGPNNLLEVPEFRSVGAGRKESVSLPIQDGNLKPGEWVRVKSANEIFATLDASGRHKGLGINPEQMAFCGRRFRIFKVLDKIRLESTGELRRMRAPTVLLEGALCDGSFHGGCDRSCFCFWREEWLARVSRENP